VGLGGLLGLLIDQWLTPEQAMAQGKKPAKPKSCILLWMNGGPSHLETFDPKPGTSTGGSTKSIKTNVPGIEIAEGFQQVAEIASELAILRGLTSKEGNHQRAQYLLHTGYAPNPTITHPSLGSWVNMELGTPKADLPNFVSISGPSIGAGFLGVQYAPFVVQNPSQPPQNINYARNVTTERFDMRRNALNQLENQFLNETGDPKVKGRQEVYSKAIRMMRSPNLKAFDLSTEPDAVKAAYGENNFGKGCLIARRLVESGVRFVEVVQDGWDTHQDGFNRTKKLLGNVDPAMATLIKDLKQRDMLDNTLVIWMGEFGRTPKINGNEGRDHYPQAWNAALAGGGVRKGIVYGATDEAGAKVVDKPTQVPDLFATIATLLGMSPSKTMMTPVGRPISLTEKGTPVRDLIA
jgi:uncharacterized protein (DUF1501 family)